MSLTRAPENISTEVLLYLSGVAACLALTGWFWLDFAQPISLAGDHLLTLGNARSFADGHGFRFNDSLGFPGVRDGMFHQAFYLIQKSIMWVTARFTPNPATVVNVFYGVGVALVFVTGYWSLRQLSIGRGLAWIGAVVFVLSPYFATRAGLHDMLAAYYSVPLGVVLALRRRADALSWLLVAIVGSSGLYYAFFSATFVAFVGVLTAVSQRRARPFVTAGLLCTGLLILLLVTGPGTGLFDVLRGDVTLTRRLPREQFLYGLVIGDAVRVFGQLPLAPAIWRDGVAGVSNEGTWNEWPGLVLTLVILASPVVALREQGRRPQEDHDARRSLVQLCAACLVFALLFATRGGLGLLFNQLVTPAIRSQNRVTPFLAFFALVIVLVWIERAWGASRLWIRVGIPAVLIGGMLLSAVPAIGVLRVKQRDLSADAATRTDRQSIDAMLGRVHAIGARAVLELPVAPWPEVPDLRSFSPYRFELPHIFDAPGSEVRWSYGLSNRQRAYARLASTVDAHRQAGLAPAAADLGFDAILIEKAAVDPAELVAWTSAIGTDVPAQCRVFEDPYRVLFSIGATNWDTACRAAAAREQ